MEADGYVAGYVRRPTVTAERMFDPCAAPQMVSKTHEPQQTVWTTVAKPEEGSNPTVGPFRRTWPCSGRTGSSPPEQGVCLRTGSPGSA